MDKVKIFNSSPLGKVKIPSSKSDAHRKIIAASMAFGQTSVISGVDFSSDILKTIDAMKIFAQIEILNNKVIINSKYPNKDKVEFDAFESGSTLRFLIPLFSHFFNETKIYGSKRLLSRPLDIYQEIYGDNLSLEEDHLILKGSLKAREYNIRGDISSQFISGLLFVLPLLKEDSKITILPPYESKSYVDLTISVLKEFGIEINEENNSYYIKGKQKYIAKDVEVESDYSQLAFFAVLGVINSTVEVEVANKKTLQGDYRIVEIIKSFNGEVEETDTGYIFKKSQLKGTTISIKDNPDLGPILFVLSLFSEGTTHILDTSRLRLKESDRILSMKEELAKFGVEIEDKDNEVVISKQMPHNTNEVINPHNDHRILMALVILSTVLENTKFEDIKCVNKSYPKFFDDLFSLGVKGEYYED